MKNIAVIFDLDYTILPTRSIPSSTFQPIFDAITSENKGRLSPQLLQEAFADLWRKPFDVVVESYGFSEAMIVAGKNALLNTEYELNLMPYDDFTFIKEISYKRFLVTTGIRKLQQAKIDSLFNEEDFDEIIIDDPYQIGRLGKQKIFADIASRHKVSADQVWVIGDNPESELKAGNALGMTTVQILRPGIERTADSTYVISSFSELKLLIDPI